MTGWELLLVGLAGGAAGFVNAVVGSGTLITFPTLLAIGLPPVLANVSNTVGLAPGSLSGVLAGRPDLVGQRGRIIQYGSATLIGSVGGALLLLRLPASAFKAIVPILIGIGCVLVVIGPALQRRIVARRERLGTSAAAADRPLWLWPVIVGTGAYGGYFGAAQGVLLIALLGLALVDPLPRINALKNVLAMIANSVAGVLFVCISRVDWWVAGAIALGSVLGAQLGARVGRRIPPTVYRVVIVLVGLVAIINLLRG